MRKFFLLTLMLTAPLVASAEEAIIVADCGDGGCTCHISPITLAEIEAISGVAAPANASQQTLVMHNREFIWSKTPRDELDLAMGGNGVCEIEVFSPITPLDGTWTGNVRVTDISGCAPAVAKMVPPMVAGMSQTQSIAWGGKFHPSKLASGGKSPVIQWTQVSSNHFTGEVPQEANGVIDITVIAEASLTAPDQAEATLTIRFDPAEGSDPSTLSLIGMNGCEANAAYDFQRVSD